MCLLWNSQFTFVLCFRFYCTEVPFKIFYRSHEIILNTFELDMLSCSEFYQNAFWRKNESKSCTWVSKPSVQSLIKVSVLKRSSSIIDTLYLLVFVFFLLSLSPKDLSPLLPFVTLFVLSTWIRPRSRRPTPLFCVFSWGNFECF